MALAGSIADYASAIRMDARLGPFANPATVTLAPAGLVFVERRRIAAYRWNELTSVRIRRGAIVVRTEAERERLVRTRSGTETRRYVEKTTRSFVPVVEGVNEPALLATFSRVLEDMRASRFTFNGTSWHEHQNAIDRLRGEFTDQDDLVLPAAAVGLWVSVGLVLMFLVPVALNVAEIRAIPAGAFVLRDRIGPLDPRTLVVAFSVSTLVTMLVLRVALGHQALVWARGVARGWKRGGPLQRFAFRQFGRALLGTSAAAVFTLIALLTFWPNMAATVLVDRTGVRNQVLLPFISVDERWAGATVLPDGTGVLIRFADGRAVGTHGRELGGGTVEQLIELASAWGRSGG